MFKCYQRSKRKRLLQTDNMPATDRHTRSKSPESEVDSLTQETPEIEATQEVTLEATQEMTEEVSNEEREDQ